MAQGRPALSAPVRLTADHDVARFDCGKAALNDWLVHHALKNEGRASRCFVVCAGSSIAGFYALAAGAVTHAEAPSAVRRNMPPSIPVVVIGRMAIDRAFQGQGLGAALLKDALRRIATASESVGVGAVLVHAKDAEIVPFYTRYGFQVFPAGSLTLFMPIRKIVAAL